MSSRPRTVACLAGDGVGPELMAETSRVLAEVARVHALHLDDLHLPFGGEALTRFGHPLPQSTREAYRSADAIFVSSPDDPAFDGVKADLDLAWRISRVHNGVRGDLVVVEPVGYGSDELRIEVHDNGSGAMPNNGHGHGLVGVRERVKIYGGEMTAGPASGGGFVLSTRLPLRGDGR